MTKKQMQGEIDHLRERIADLEGQLAIAKSTSFLPMGGVTTSTMTAGTSSYPVQWFQYPAGGSV